MLTLPTEQNEIFNVFKEAILLKIHVRDVIPISTRLQKSIVYYAYIARKIYPAHVAVLSAVCRDIVP